MYRLFFLLVASVSFSELQKYGQNSYKIDFDVICSAPDMISSDDETDDQYPSIEANDSEDVESLRDFIKHTIKELAAADNNYSNEFVRWW